jgi:MYND finger
MASEPACVAFFKFNRITLRIGNKTEKEFDSMFEQWREEASRMKLAEIDNVILLVKVLSLTLLPSALFTAGSEFFANQREEIKKVMPTLRAARGMQYNEETGYGQVYLEQTEETISDELMETCIDEAILKFCKGVYIGLLTRKIPRTEKNSFKVFQLDAGLTEEAFMQKNREITCACALPSCSKVALYFCVCMDVKYCSKECQRKHWKMKTGGHKAVCPKHPVVGSKFVEVKELSEHF